MPHLSVQEVIERPTKPVRPRKTSERMTITPVQITIVEKLLSAAARHGDIV
jgi:hypothetical protein